MADYLPILVMAGVVVAFVSLSFVASQLLAPQRPNAAKQAPYECGIVPEAEPAERFPVKFYLVAMSFIVLDVEIVFLYPFSVVFRGLGLYGLVAMTFIVLDVEIIFLYPFTTIFRNFVPAAYGLAIMGVFLLTLLVPFAYLLSTGALDWGPMHKLVDRARPGVLRASGRPGAGGLDPTAVAPDRDTEAA